MNRRQERQRKRRVHHHLQAQAFKREFNGEKAKPKPHVKQPRKPR